MSMSGSDDTCSVYDTCSTNEWPNGRGKRGKRGKRGERGQEEEHDRSSHSSDLDFIADELEDD
jgi:hypothetical protein